MFKEKIIKKLLTSASRSSELALNLKEKLYIDYFIYYLIDIPLHLYILYIYY